MDESGRTVVKGRHLLSVRDLNLSDRIGELIDAGITSFKIEGRLKDIGYIKNVVSYYRQRIDRALASRPGFCRSSVGESRPDFQPDPSKSFTRGESEYFFDGRRAGVASFDTPKAVGEPLGRIVRVDRGSFTLSGPCDLAPGDGICLLTRNGLAGTNVNEVAGSRIVPNRMEGVVAGAEVFRNFDRRFSLALDRSRTRRVIPVRADAAITPLRVTVRFTDCEGVAAEVTRDGVFEPAKDSRKMSETVAAQLSRSGDTIFDVREVRSEGCDRFVPVSLLAELRREGLERLRRRGSTALSSMRFCPRIDRRPIRRKSLRPRRMLRIVWPRSFTAITGCGKLHADSIWNLRRQGIRSCVRPIAFGVRSDSA